ncbi:hypothetical protein V6N13_057312 [Hibiscus sabdariffa]
MIPGLPKWDERKVKQIFSRNDAQSILNCPIANVKEDVLRWSHHHSGLYVTKTAHHWLEKQGWVKDAVSPIWKVLSKANVLPKVISWIPKTVCIHRVLIEQPLSG